MLERIINRLFTHWKTSVVALYVALFTVMLVLGKIDVKEWETAIGAIATVIGFMAKDWDKTHDPDNDNLHQTNA